MEVFPPQHSDRTLVVCFDGTGEGAHVDDDTPSNVLQLFSMLYQGNEDQQKVIYQPGVGTDPPEGLVTLTAKKSAQALDEAVAWNLTTHIISGYQCLVDSYRAGDRISLFGFSRGAYTARALAGMLHKVGLLPAGSEKGQIQKAYDLYAEDDNSSAVWERAKAFKQQFCRSVKVDFIGVWDTVNSVGIVPYDLPFSKSNSSIRVFRHAMALDERRIKFRINFWGEATDEDRKTTGESEHPEDHTDVEEVWFAGCHSDVGGGAVKRGTSSSLSLITLRWMIRECFKVETGIMFDPSGLREVGMEPSRLYPVVAPRPPPLPVRQMRIRPIPEADQPTWNPITKIRSFFGKRSEQKTGSAQPVKSEEEHELDDALAPIYDRLEMHPAWWALEVLPLENKYQEKDGTWSRKFEWNFGHGRFIPRQKSGTVKVHRSVRMRLEAVDESGEKYVPKASFDEAKELGHLVWVD